MRARPIRTLRFRAGARAATLLLLLAMSSLSFAPAAADHRLWLWHHPAERVQPDKPLTLRFKLDYTCHGMTETDSRLTSNGVATAARATVKGSCEPPEVRVVYWAGRDVYGLDATLRDEYHGSAVIPKRHLRPGRAIRYVLVATQRRCDTTAAVGVFVGCLPSVAAHPTDCHDVAAETPTYRVRVGS